MTQAFDIPWHRLDPAKPPVVLMGGVNVTRCLGMAGVPVIVASSDPSEPAFASRYCIGRCDLPPADASGAVADALVLLGDALQRRFGVRVPLMYGSDDALELVHEFRDRLAPYFAFLMSDPEVTSVLIAKDRFHDFCESRQVLSPATLSWEGEGPGSLRGASGEVLVKPKLKRGWHRSRIFRSLFGGAGKARIFRNIDALGHPLVARFRRHLLFQEYIPGGEGDLWSFHGFIDERGELLASFVGRKLRTYPAETGESAFIELVHDEALSALGRQIAERCSLRGVFKMDFKRDPRDGRSYLLEINARFNLWQYLGAANGLNIPAIVYDYLVSGTPPRHATRYGTQVRWLSWPLDVKGYRELALLGRLHFLPWLLSLLSFRIVYSVFDWKDPGPWLRGLSQRFKRLRLRLAPD